MENMKHQIAPKLLLELSKESEHPYNLKNDHIFRT